MTFTPVNMSAVEAYKAGHNVLKGPLNDDSQSKIKDPKKQYQ